MLPEPLLPKSGRRVFVALGDSFTEGVGDRDERLPNGVRGWADRVAEKLAKAQEETQQLLQPARAGRCRQVRCGAGGLLVPGCLSRPAHVGFGPASHVKGRAQILGGQVLDQLGVPHKIRRKDWEPRARASVREWERQQRRWIHDWVLPLFGRKLRGVTLGDALGPRWPDPVKVPRKGGLKKLAGASHGRPREY